MTRMHILSTDKRHAQFKKIFSSGHPSDINDIEVAIEDDVWIEKVNELAGAIRAGALLLKYELLQHVETHRKYEIRWK